MIQFSIIKKIGKVEKVGTEFAYVLVKKQLQEIHYGKRQPFNLP